MLWFLYMISVNLLWEILPPSLSPLLPPFLPSFLPSFLRSFLPSFLLSFIKYVLSANQKPIMENPVVKNRDIDGSYLMKLNLLWGRAMGWV